MPMRELNLFITYSHHDSDILLNEQKEPTEFLRVLLGLRREKVEVNYDRGFLKAGDKWGPRIEENLSKCDILVPILTDDFLQSEFCNNVEVPAILEKQRNGHDVLVTPFYYRYCNWAVVPWIKERDIRPSATAPYQAISVAHERTKAMINFRSEILSQANLIRAGLK